MLATMYAEFQNKVRHAECHSAECHSSVCRGLVLGTVSLACFMAVFVSQLAKVLNFKILN